MPERTGEEGATRRVVERYFALLAAGAAPEEIAALFGEEVDWDIPGDLARVPWIGPRRGRAGVADFFRALELGIEPGRFEVRSLLVQGNEAAALGELVSRVRGSGVPVESEFVIWFRVEKGEIVHYRLLEDSFAVARAASPRA